MEEKEELLKLKNNHSINYNDKGLNYPKSS